MKGWLRGQEWEDSEAHSPLSQQHSPTVIKKWRWRQTPDLAEKLDTAQILLMWLFAILSVLGTRRNKRLEETLYYRWYFHSSACGCMLGCYGSIISLFSTADASSPSSSRDTGVSDADSSFCSIQVRTVWQKQPEQRPWSCSRLWLTLMCFVRCFCFRYLV